MNDKTSGPNLQGPESIPIREYVKHFPIVVSLYKIDTDELVRQETIDYGNYEHRKWLGRVTYFACSNGMLVETAAVK